MAHEKSRNLQLGLFVVAGGVLLVLALYLIGSKQNLFGNTFMLKVRFHNVNGLMQGNNVRFAGIDIGTVSQVEIENDTTVIVSMVLEDKIQKFIKRNAVASVGSDGLMGNKLVNINASPYPASIVDDGYILSSLRPIETDEMVRTLNKTNENILVVTNNLRVITDNISNRNSFWHLLADSMLAQDLKSTVTGLRQTTENAGAFTRDLRSLSQEIKQGKGIGALLKDSLLPYHLSQSANNLQVTTDSFYSMSRDLNAIVHALNRGEGSIGYLIRDTSFAQHLNRSVVHIDTAAVNFDRNMRAMHYSWPFKKGYRKMKESKK
jgi:phospholipid/cholesterol/gamma-HCH transport system substrate-binding protein